MNLTPEGTVGRIAVEYPQSTRVFHRHGIDFCCGGGRALDEVCSKRGLDAETLLDEIRNELADPIDDATRWDLKPLDEVIDHIMSVYHAPLREELVRLAEMADKVFKVHGDKNPDGLGELRRLVHALNLDLDHHMGKEEQILFPLIRQKRGADAWGPISVMESEHETAGATLSRLRELTGDYTVPKEACTTWRALWAGLEDLESSLHRHIHLENNVLFPRALAGA